MKSKQYEENSLSLTGSVAMGTGVMIGAGIFALTGQVAEQAGGLFPLAFLAAGIVAGFSAYSYVKMAAQYPSAGGIATFLMKAYGKGTVTAGMALMMYFSMVINESLVARTFGAYSLQLVDVQDTQFWVPALGVGLLVAAFIINILGNRFIGTFSTVTAVIKISGIVIFAAAGLWVSGLTFDSVGVTERTSAGSFLSATALALLAYKGFTTITNSGSEITEPKKNIGRSIIISLLVCVIVYVLVGLAVAGNLTVDEIIEHRDYALAEAARPTFGQWGTYFTVGLAIVATISGLIASTFAVSRMLAMLTEMKLVPHRHFGMPGDIQKHTLVYTVVIAITLTILFDLSRIASLGAIFYIIMDLAVHWAVLKHLREEVSARPWVPVIAIALDLAILGAFVWMKVNSDMLVIWVALGGILFVFAGEKLFLSWKEDDDDESEHADVHSA
ncbi:APC family permease [Novipirellula artificiosorum]|uniref:Inner membrane transport protein YbaT n=1 Tax=Novipirellula artificiosorum TaxID=2528016 RepID=A0A5C6DSZ7_9BACT|nr:APC family permease [Novipirellula artificiosorum]TWU39425.1 Inner membrane transport protein YbaT [Novipirellula artificiosorum]